MTKKAISVVVPIYNEQESLPDLVNQILAAMRPTGESFELIVVNDGSTDRSAEVLSQLSSEVSELNAEASELSSEASEDRSWARM